MRAALTIASQGCNSLFIRHGNTHNITSGTLKPPDLAYGRSSIPGISTGHGLHAHRGLPTHRYIADHDCLRMSALFHTEGSCHAKSALQDMRFT